MSKLSFYCSLEYLLFLFLPEHLKGKEKTRAVLGKCVKIARNRGRVR